ncbi:MAG: hypothetical protein ABII18_09320, partial [bacterium]
MLPIHPQQTYDYAFRATASHSEDNKHELVTQVETQLSEDRNIMLHEESVAGLKKTQPPQVTENYLVFGFKEATVNTIKNSILKLNYYNKLDDSQKELITQQIAEAIMVEMEYRVERANEHLPGHLLEPLAANFKDLVESRFPLTLKNYFVWNGDKPIEKESSVIQRFVSLMRLYDQTPLTTTPEILTEPEQATRYINPEVLQAKLHQARARYIEIEPMLQSCSDLMRAEMQMSEQKVTNHEKPEIVFLQASTSLAELDSFVTNHLLPLPEENRAPFLNIIGAEIAGCFAT